VPVAAQTIEWGQTSADQATIVVVVPAVGPELKITIDKDSVADVIAARQDQPVVKSYTVEPGTYLLYLEGSDDPVSVSVPAGSVQIVAYDPEKAQLYTEDFRDAAASLEAQGARNWIWLGKQPLSPDLNQIFFSPRPGTDDPGPMAPQE
jgi:hypothetical protein